MLKLKIENKELRKLYSDKQTTDSGYDLYLPHNVSMKKGEVKLVDLEIKGEPSSGYWLTPRSSIYRYPIMLCNSPGLIDIDYRGNLKIALRALDDCLIKKHTRLVQAVFPSLEPFKVEFVDEINETKRGSNGFGSTGK